MYVLYRFNDVNWFAGRKPLEQLCGSDLGGGDEFGRQKLGVQLHTCIIMVETITSSTSRAFARNAKGR